jgi:hypothetical protein
LTPKVEAPVTTTELKTDANSEETDQLALSPDDTGTKSPELDKE